EGDGLFFYFEHTDKGHTLVIMDRSAQLIPLAGQPQIRYHTASVTETADVITQWTAHRVLQSGRMSVQTFDYKQPNNTLPVSMTSLNEQGDVQVHEVYEYAVPCSHRHPDDGEALLRNRIEAYELQGKFFKGAGNCRVMRSGFTF